MASQEEQVEAPATEAKDTAEFAGAWDDLEAEEAGQPAPAAGRQDETDQGQPKPKDEAGQVASSDTPPADAAPASREETSDDVWATADPKLREAHENALKAAETKAAKAENLARSNGGRLTKALNELSSLQQTLAPKKSGDATEEGGEATDLDQRIEQLGKDYPEVAAPLLEKMAKLEGQVAALSSTATARAETEVEQALSDEHQALLDQHTDLADIVKAPEYAEWLKGQPPSIRRIVQDNTQAVVSAEDAGMVFAKFKSETGFGKAPEPTPAEKAAAERRAEQLDAGRTATGGTQPGIRSDARADGTFGEAWDEFERKDQQKAAARRR